MRIEPDGQGGWRIVRDDDGVIGGFLNAVEASQVADTLTASAPVPVTDGETSDPATITAAITASTVDVPARPPAIWFQNPQFADADVAPDPLCADIRGCPLTITDEGQVFGHAALWNSCHAGYGDKCVPPPRSQTNYSKFRYGHVVTADGQRIPTGPLTVGTGHAHESLSAAQTIAHYDNTGTAVADVACGEDQYGIWVAGAIRPGATIAQVEALRRSPLSGDWREPVDQLGVLEMHAALAVNTPGFGVPQFGLAASALPHTTAYMVEGRAVSLVAAGATSLARIAAAPWSAGHAALAQRLEVLEKAWANYAPVVDPLAAQAARDSLTAALEPVTAAAANTPGSNFADPGFQKDGKQRYPLDSAAHTRAAISYLSQSANAAKYTAQQLSSMKGKIRSAAKKYGVTLSDSF